MGRCRLLVRIFLFGLINSGTASTHATDDTHYTCSRVVRTLSGGSVRDIVDLARRRRKLLRTVGKSGVSVDSTLKRW